MSDDLYTLIGYQELRQQPTGGGAKLNTFPTMTGMRVPPKSLSGLLRKLINWKAQSVHEQIRLATDRLKNEDWFAISKSLYAELRSVGFDSTYENGLRFLEWYCDRLRGRYAALP